MHVGCIYKYICNFKRSVSCAATKLKSRGFDFIWQVRFKLSRMAEAQLNTRMTEIPPLLDVFLYHASKRHILTFLSTRYYIIRPKLICRMTLNTNYLYFQSSCVQ